MKNNTTKKASAKKKLLPAAGSLLISAAMLGTSTYAWFTMNKEVTLTGMEVKTHVGSNLLIQKSTIAGTAIEGEDGFITDETQAIAALLEPVSTVDGKTFYYTLDAKADGDKLHTPVGLESGATPFTLYNPAEAATGSGASSYGNKFSQDYGATTTIVNNFASGAYRDSAVGYVDYVFQLKATNTESSAQDINLTELNLTYNGGSGASEAGNKAFRAAVFVSDAVAAGGTFDDWSDSNALPAVKAIYKNSGAANFEDGKAVDSTNTRGTVTYNATPALASVSAGSISYYKVVVRLWIEGDDTTCNTSTFKPLDNKWSLDLKMELGQGTKVSQLSFS